MKIETNIFLGIYFFLMNISLYAQEDPNLFLHFPFDGNTDEVIGNLKNEETYGGTAVADRFGEENGAFYFDGRDDYFKADLIEPLCTSSGVSMSAWIKLEEVFGVKEFFSIHNRDTFLSGCYSSISTRFAHNMVCFGYSDNTGGICPWDQQRSIKDTIWYHIAGSIDRDGTATVYVNGEMVQSFKARNPLHFTYELDRILMSSDFLFNRGNIDDLRIYTRVLSPCEMQALFQGEEPLEVCSGAQAVLCLPREPLSTSVYPNPVRYRLLIHVEGRPEDYRIEWDLYNAHGQFISSGITNCNDDYIQFSKFPSGIYYLKFENQIQKIIKVNY